MNRSEKAYPRQRSLLGSIDHLKVSNEYKTTAQMTAHASCRIGPCVFSVCGLHFQSANTFPGLVPYIYTITLKDAYNCMDGDSAIIEEEKEVFNINQTHPIPDNKCQASNIYGERLNNSSFANYDNVETWAGRIYAGTSVSQDKPPRDTISYEDPILRTDWVEQGRKIIKI